MKLTLLLVSLFVIHVNISAQNFTFGMCTDVHYAAIPDNGTRKYSRSLDKLAQCIDTMNREKTGFLIELGDFKDMTVPPDNKAALGFLQTAETAFSRFRGDRYHVLGNHDMDCISKKEFYSIAENSHISKDKTWYSFQKGGYKFIVLDACFDSTGRSYDSGNFDWSDANIPASQMEWLETELSMNKLPVIVFVHQLLYGNSKPTIKNSAAVRNILEKGKQVKCVFQGHDHKGGYELINGIHYYTLKGMVEGNFPESNSFAIVSLSGDKILIRGYGNAVSQTLTP
jgi:alkaline phosphatase